MPCSPPCGFDKESQERAGEGYGYKGEEEEDEEKEEGEEEDGVNGTEPVERARGESRAKRKRVALDEGVASTARSSSRSLHAKRAPNGPMDRCSTTGGGFPLCGPESECHSEYHSVARTDLA